MSLLRLTDFRNLLVGATLSQLGDVAFMIALPWLVLQMTGSGLALGSILLVVAIPRAALMLVGGAVSDRLPARTVLIASNSVLMLTVAAVAILGADHALALWMLYVVGIVFGIADAFGGPAMKVLLPSIVAKDALGPANSLLQSATQVCLLAGGAAAGLMIQRFGIMPAFAIDACSFIFLIGALLLMSPAKTARVKTSSLVASIGAGVRYVLTEPSFRVLLLVIASINFCISGATQVGIAALVHAHFGSAAYFGIAVTVSAVGSLAGIVLAGIWRRRENIVFPTTCATVLLGACIAALALDFPFVPLCIVLAISGIIAGYVNVTVLTWLQASVAPDMLGRVMSLVALSSAGIAPISLAIAGFIAGVSLQLLFVAAGGALIAISIAGATISRGPRAVEA